jgi:hypothetical protein
MSRLNAYHLRSSNFDGASVTSAKDSLAANHPRTVTEHGHADERIRVVMPADNGLIVFWVAASGISFLLGFMIGVQLTLYFLVRLDADVDVAELEFHVGNEINTRDL